MGAYEIINSMLILFWKKFDAQKASSTLENICWHN